MTQTEALRLAFEALIEIRDANIHGLTLTQDYHETITAIKAALANEALERKAENARELGLDYYVSCCTDQTCQKCKAALEANEFNPDWDEKLALTEEIIRLSKRIEELEANDKPYAFEASIYSNDRVKVDPVTGNVSIGTPQQEAKDEPVATDWERIARVQNAKLMAVCDGAGGFEKLCEVMDKYEAITPPQRTWMGLTEEEIEQGCKESWITEQAFQSAVWWAEAKLRSKND